jgi:hypothetical protein
MSWIIEKSYRELARIREAKEKQVYPYFKPFESGGHPLAASTGSPSSTSAPTTTWA